MHTMRSLWSRKALESVPLTLPKFNMEPENGTLEKEIPALETFIFRFHVKLGEGTREIVAYITKNFRYQKCKVSSTLVQAILGSGVFPQAVSMQLYR